MSNNQSFRRPDQVSETFIVTAVILIFITVGVILFYVDRNIVMKEVREKNYQKDKEKKEDLPGIISENIDADQMNVSRKIQQNILHAPMKKEMANKMVSKVQYLCGKEMGNPIGHIFL